jgi:hypothetical protein
MECEGSVPYSQELSTFSYSEPDQSSPHYTILSLKINLGLRLPSGLFPSDFPANSLHIRVSLLPISATCSAHIILFDFISLIILGKGTNHEAPRYAVYPNLPSRHHSSFQIFSSAPSSQTPSVYVPLLIKFFDCRREDKKFWTEW